MISSLVLYFVTMLVATAGFAVAFYIYEKKHAKRPLVCPLRMSCDSVTESKHARVLGVPVELVGMLYYLVVIVCVGLIVWNGFIFLLLPTFIIATLAFLFSLYLFTLQAFVIRAWCSWCLLSTATSTIIFILLFIIWKHCL